MEVDRLEIAIETQAKSVSKEIDSLYNNLGRIATALNRTSTGYRSAAKEAGRMVSAFRSLASVKVPDFGNLVSQLTTLSKIKLDNLQKRINIDIDVNSHQTASNIKYAIEKAMEETKVDSSKLADKIISDFRVTGSGKQAIRKEFEDIVANLKIDSNGIADIIDYDALSKSMDAIVEAVTEHGKMFREEVTGMVSDAEESYKDFYEYIKAFKGKLFISDDLKSGVGLTEFRELIQQMPGWMTTSAQKGTTQVNAIWEEMSDRWPHLFPKDTISDAEQLVVLMDRIREAEAAIKPVNIFNMDGSTKNAAQSLIYDSAYEASGKLKEQLQNGFKSAMEEASKSLTLDVEVNQDKIVRDIQSAVNKASQATFTPVKVTLDVDKGGVANKVQAELKNINVGNLTEISNAYSALVNEYSRFNNVASNAKGINQMVKTIKELATSDLSGFDGDKFASMTQAIGSLASMTDVSGTINKLVNALTRLARAGNDIDVAAQALPALGAALRDVFDQIGASNVDTSVEHVLSALTRLATSGDKANTAAQNLPSLTSAIRDFIDSMAEAPVVNDTTLRMTEAFTQLATSGKRIGSIGGQVGKSLNQVSSSSNKANSSLGKLNKTTGTVMSAFKKLLSTCGSVVGGIGSGAAKIVSHFKLIGNGSKHINQARVSLKNLLQVALGFYGIRTLFNWGKQAIELASDLTEVQNVVENSFGTKGTANIENFAKTANTSFGITELTAKKTAARFQAMGNAMGITTGQVAEATQNVADKINDAYNKTGETMGDMSVNLTKLTADMASFYNDDQEKVAEAMNAVYTGQTRPLRQYGLDLTQATLQEWANKQGIEGKISAMSQAEKTMLRYQYVMANTNTIQGDFARTSQTWANQVRILKQNFQALGSTIGSTIINAFRPLVVWLNKVMSSVISFAETVGNALGKIFGWKIMHTPASNAADVYDTLSDSLGDTGDAGDDAADGLGKATKAANEYKNTVLGFDELNKLNDVTNSSGSSGSGSGSGSGTGGAGGADGTGADFQMVKDDTWFEKYKSNINSLYELGSYISDTLRETLSSIKWEEEVFPAAEGFGEGLASFLNGLIKPETFEVIGTTAAQAINTALHFLDSFGTTFDWKNFGNSLASGLRSFLTTLDWKLAAKNFKTFTNGILDAMNSALDTFAEGNGFYTLGVKIRDAVKDALGGIEWDKAYSAADKFGSGLASFLNGLIDEDTFGTIGDTVAGVLNTALHALDTFGETFSWTKFGNSIAAGINRFFSKFQFSRFANTFNNFATGILTSINEAITKINWENIGYKIRQFLMKIKWTEILQSVGTLIGNALNAAIKFAKGLFDGTPLEEALGKVQEICNNVASQINFDGIKEGLQGILDVGLKFTAGFMEGFTGAMAVLADIGVGVLNGIGFAVGWIADGLNSLDPSVVQKLGEALGIVAAALVTMKIANGVATTISGVVAALTGTTAAATGASAAVSGAASALGTAGATGVTAKASFSGLAKAAITSTGAIEGGLIGAAVLVGQKLGEMSDKARGGNGVLTEMGGIMDNIGDQFAPKVQNGLFKVKEELENTNATTDEAATKFADFFLGEHIDAETLKNALITVKGEINVTEQQADLLDKVLEKMGDQATTTAKQVNMTEEDYKGFKNVLADMVKEGSLGGDTMEHLDSVLQANVGVGTAEDAYNDLTTALSEMGIETDTFTKKAKEEVPSAFSSIETSSSNAASKISGVASNFKDLSDTASTKASGIKDSIGGAFGDIGTKAEDAETKSDSLKSGFWDFAGQAAVKSLLMAVVGTTFSTMGTNAETAQGKVSGLQTKVKGFADNISNYKGTAGKNAKDIGTTVPTELGKGIDEKKDVPVQSMDDMLTDMISMIGADFGQDYSVVDGWGKNIDTTLASSITNGKSGVSDSMKGVGKAIKDTITGNGEGGLGIHSPSDVMDGYGQNIDQGLINGINALKSSVASAMGTLVSGVKREITNEQANFRSAGESLVSNFKSGLNSIKLSDVASGWKTALNMSGLTNTLYTAGHNAAQSLRNGMKSVSMPRLSYYISSWNSHSLTNGQTGYTPVYSPQWYKMGGFPNVGEMFIANESGPEMVGKMGRKNVVANNMQITAGIKEAVVEGMMEVAMSGALSQGGNDGTPIIVESKLNVDGETLARTVERGMAKRAHRFNTVGYSY